MLSPGVEIIEKDVSLRIPSVTSSVGGIVVAAEKGPLNQLTLVTNEADYIDIFGRPDDVNYPHWFTATEFLQESNQLYVVRTEDSDTLVAGVTVGISASDTTDEEIPLAWPTPKEAQYFPMSYDFIGVGGSTPDDPAMNPDRKEAWDGLIPVFGTDGEEVYHVYGIGAGTIYNSVSFVAINALDYQQLLNMREELSQATTRDEIEDIAEKYYNGTPATTGTSGTSGNPYLSNSLVKFDVINVDAGGNFSVDNVTLTQYTSVEFGPEVAVEDDPESPNFGQPLNEFQQDEFIVYVYDELGNPTESYVVSKLLDKRNSQGNRMFAPDVINGNSSSIFFFIDGTETGAGGSRIISSGRVFLQGADQLTGFNGQPITALDGEIQTQWIDKFTNKEILEVDILLDPDYSTVNKQLLDDICQNIRKDCFAILNVPVEFMINTSTGRPHKNYITQMKDYVNQDLNINSSYSAIYGQYFDVFDRFAEKQRWVPATGWVGAIYARVDFTNAQWWAPAGLNRAIISGVQNVAVNPNQGQRDVLYGQARINPIVDFIGDGIVIWGQKTMLTRPSAFDRINVRRLFLHMERSIEKMARFLLFEFNDDFTRARFRGQVNPFLTDIQTRRGITDYQVVCDETNNTPEVIDNNEFRADILVKPNRVAEFITLTFVAVATGVEFSEVTASAV